MTQAELIERLADAEHASWARWMAYLFSRCVRDDRGVLTIPTHLVMHWQRQIDTPYAELSEREKQSDRDEVAHILPLMEAYAQMAAHDRDEALEQAACFGQDAARVGVENTRLRAALHGVVRSWDALCRCTDEFEPEDMAACAEYRDALDARLVMLKSLLVEVGFGERP